MIILSVYKGNHTLFLDIDYPGSGIWSMEDYYRNKRDKGTEAQRHKADKKTQKKEELLVGGHRPKLNLQQASANPYQSPSTSTTNSTGQLSILLFPFQFPLFLWTKLGLFALFSFAFIFFSFITHICFSLLVFLFFLLISVNLCSSVANNLLCISCNPHYLYLSVAN